MIRQAAIDDLVARAHREVDEGLLPSCQLAIGYEGEVIEQVTLGDAPAGNDARFVMFSATKAVVASTIWQLLAEDKLALDDRIADRIPEFGTNGKDIITLEQVLLHTSGFPHGPLGPPAWGDRDQRVAAFGKWRLNWEPGSQYEYHPTAAHWVLAELIARADGVDHREAIRTRVLDPLGLQSLRVGVPAAEQGNIQTVQNVGEPPTSEELMAVLGVSEIDVGEVTEDALLLFAEPAQLEVGVPGGGAVSTAADIVRFYQALLHNPDKLWDPSLLAMVTSEVRNTFPDPMLGVPANRALGVIVAGDDGLAPRRGFGHGVSPGTFGHNGAGGQVAWADPATGVSFAYLTNGLDRNPIREGRRSIGLSSRAAKVAS